MAVIYESKRFPAHFIRTDVSVDEIGGASEVYPGYGGPRNGSMAAASYAHKIIENGHWLALADTPMINFFEYKANGDNATPPLFGWTNSTRTLNLIVPPFCRFADFHFLCVVDFDSADDNHRFIQLISPVASRAITNFPWGQDLSAYTPPKASLPYATADWVHFAGTSDQTDVTGSLRVYNDATIHETWETVAVDIDVSQRVFVLAAAYKVVPAFGSMQVNA